MAFHYVAMVKLNVPHEASWVTWLLALCGDSAEILSLFSTLFTSTLKKTYKNPRKTVENPKLTPKNPYMNPKETLKKPIWKCIKWSTLWGVAPVLRATQLFTMEVSQNGDNYPIQSWMTMLYHVIRIETHCDLGILHFTWVIKCPHWTSPNH